MSRCIIEVRGLSKSYDKGIIQALDDVNLTLEEGKIYALMGPSGCGKSTLLNLIGTLDEPDCGEILYENRPLNAMGRIDSFRRDFMGFIFQFHHLIPVLTLRENVESALLSNRRISSSEREKKAVSLLNQMGLKSRINSYASEISGGERQRGAIARALVNEPKVILADEPTGNVDSKTAEGILDILHEHVRSKKGCILIATHDFNVAAISDVCITMKDGRIASIKENSAEVRV